jgi:serine/threonine-protein kinase HipA
VAYAAMSKRIGHALRLMPDNMMTASVTKNDGAGQRIKPALTPAVLRAFTAALDIAEKPANSALRECVKAAYTKWPRMIAESPLTEQQKSRLLAHFMGHPAIVSLRERADRAAAKAAP